MVYRDLNITITNGNGVKRFKHFNHKWYTEMKRKLEKTQLFIARQQQKGLPFIVFKNISKKSLSHIHFIMLVA
jgi:hypothetical protein